MDDTKEDGAKVPSKKRAFLISFLPWLLAFIGWVFVVVKDTVHAQVLEGVTLVHELPVTKVKVETMETDIRDIKSDLREQRRMLYESQKDVKYLIKRFDNKYGSR